ncbi:MAG: zinc ribbon domain-containing protein [Rudaea sp.]
MFKTRVRMAWPALAGVVLALWLASAAFAQSDDRLSSLSISAWPEYDKASVLVQYDGQVAGTESFPRTISVLVPSAAEVNAVAYISTAGEMLNTDLPTTEDAGEGFKRITFKLPTPKFHLEYYDDLLKGSPDKTMEFVYKAAQAADNVQFEIQQPLGATNFKTDPATQLQSTDAHKFTYHIFNYASVSAGQTVKIKATYTRTDPNPSVAGLPTPNAPTAASTEAAAGGTNSTTVIAAGLIAAAIALLALAGFYWWSRNRQVAAPVVAGGGRPRRKGRSGGSGAAGFCSQCGRALSADDNFCPRCGTPRRKG